MSAPNPAGLRRFLARLSGLFRARRLERELAEELQSNLYLHVEDNLSRGMSPQQAWRDARLKFGGLEQAREATHDVATFTVLENTWRDVRYGVRGLGRNPVFAAAAILSLALGVGAAIAIFTLADNLLLRPLPYPDPGALMMVWEVSPPGNARNSVSPANYLDWKARNDVFTGLAALRGGPVAFAAGARVEELQDQFVTAGLLPLLGVAPLRGRFFPAADDRPGAPNVVLISYRLWQAWFGGDAGIVGRTVQVASQPATIVGVMPPGFYFRDRDVDLWQPLGLDPAQDYRQTVGRYLNAVARLKPGVTRARAQDRMSAIARRLETDYPQYNTHWRVNVEPLRESLVGGLRPSILVLLGAVGLLLAVACANVANLLLARYSARRREMAVRLAIGAGRRRLIRQLLAESAVLGLIGGGLGWLLARWTVAALLRLAPVDLTRNIAIAMDYRIVLFALGTPLLTVLLFGLAPALVASRADLTASLREESSTGIGSGGRMRAALVVAETAVAVMLLAGAGLLFRTLVDLRRVQPGLNPTGVLTFRVQLPDSSYPLPDDRTRFFTQALDRIRGLPGVESASAVSYLPFDGMAAGTDLAIAGEPPPKPGEGPAATIRTVMPDYFRTMEIPLVRGRVFTAADDTPDSQYRFVVSQAFVREYLPGANPLGQRISVDMEEGRNPFGEIIGVVGDVKEDALGSAPQPTVYYIHAHLPGNGMVFVVRAANDPLALAGPVRRAMRTIDPAQPASRMRTMSAVVRETFARQSFSALLLGGFSLVSLLLAAVGIYGVLAYSIAARTREIGLRIALGAAPGRIFALVLGNGLRGALWGALLGTAGALALSGLLDSLLFGVTAHDLATFVAVPLILLAVAALASYLPARRATRVNPVIALRAQ